MALQGGGVNLSEKLQAAGLRVVEYPGWETLTNDNRDRVETVGIVQHWDAIIGWPGVHKYTHKNRFGGLLYHIVVRQDGIVALLSQRYAWHAGKGDLSVLSALRDERVPPYPTDQTADDRILGNPYLFGVCINYHPDEGAIKPEQYESLVKVNAVLLQHFDLKPVQIIDHDHWTTRKWDIRTMDLNQFRKDVEEELMTPEQIREIVREELTAHFGPSWEAEVDGKSRRYVRGVLDSAWHPGISGTGKRAEQVLAEIHDMLENLNLQRAA